MGKYYRKKFTRKSYRRRRISKRFNFKKYLRRKPKPEIKFLSSVSNGVSVNPGLQTITRLNPSQITLGPGQGQATGRFVRSRYLKPKITITQAEGSGNVGANFMTRLRVSILQPRADEVPVSNHIAAVSNLGTYDPAIVGVIYDQYVYLTTPTSTSIQATPVWKYSKAIRHPRKIQLADNGNFLQYEDNILLVVTSTSNNNSQVIVYGNAVLTYIDN